MDNIYQTLSDGHDFFPYGDWGRKPTREEIEEWVTENIPLKIENMLESDDQTLNKGSLTFQLKKFTEDRVYRRRQVRRAVDYINDVDWSALSEKYSWGVE